MLVHVNSIGAMNVVRTGPRGDTPLVLLHPVSMDVSWWSEQFKEFHQERDVIAIDLPGHGLSEQPDGPLTFTLMSNAVLEVLDSVGVTSAHLLGVSVGGMIAQAVALQRPAMVRSLALVATLCTFPEQVRTLLRERARVARVEGMGRIAELSIERWFTPAFRAQRPDVIARATIGLLRQPGEFHARMWEMIASLDLVEKLHFIRCPTLVITGTEDINAPPTAAEQIAQEIPGAVVHLLPGLGHFPHIEDADGFNAILRTFLSDITE